jgi:hypothetical protein
MDELPFESACMVSQKAKFSNKAAIEMLDCFEKNCAIFNCENFPNPVYNLDDPV